MLVLPTGKLGLNAKLHKARMDLVKFTKDRAVWRMEVTYYLRLDRARVGGPQPAGL